MVSAAQIGNLDTVDNLSQREYIQIGVQPQFGIEAPWFVTTPVIPGTGSYQAGKLQLLDTGRRGVNASDFGAQEGVGEGTITIESEMRIADEDGDQMMALGYLLANILETGTRLTGSYALGSRAITDNDLNQDGNQADNVRVHNLTPGTRKQYLTVKHGVTDVFEHTYLDCKATNLALSFTVGEGFATFSTTLMGQDRIVEEDVKGVDDVFSSSGLLVAGWHCKGTIPSGQVQGTATLKASATADLDDTFASQIQNMDWSIDRDAERFYGADATQDMNDIFLGPLTATVALSVIFRDSDDIQLYTKKVQGAVTSDCIPQYEGKQLPNGKPNRAIRIASRNTDFADELLAVNLGDIHAMLPFAARALYTPDVGPLNSGGTQMSGAYTATPTDTIVPKGANASNGGIQQHGPLQLQLIQHQGDANPARFTDLVPPPNKTLSVPLQGTVGNLLATDVASLAVGAPTTVGTAVGTAASVFRGATPAATTENALQIIKINKDGKKLAYAANDEDSINYFQLLRTAYDKGPTNNGGNFTITITMAAAGDTLTVTHRLLGTGDEAVTLVPGGAAAAARTIVIDPTNTDPSMGVVLSPNNWTRIYLSADRDYIIDIAPKDA